MYITEPGVYCLNTDSLFLPTQPGYSAIVIDLPSDATAGVVLDLGGKTLAQGNSTLTTCGILVTGQKDVTIRNGTIRDFTLDGIQTDNSDLIFLEDLHVINCGSTQGSLLGGGILVMNSQNIYLTSVNSSENTGVGVGLSGVNNFFMTESHCDATTGFPNVPLFGNAAIGFAATALGVPPLTSTSSNIFVSNSSFDNTTGEVSAFGVLAGGIGATPTPTNYVFTDCIAQNVSATGEDAIFAEGISIGGVDGVLISNCTVNGLVSNGTSTNHIVGIEVSVGANNALIENCLVTNLSGSAIYVHAFDIEGEGNNITFKNCTAYNVLNSSPDETSLALGFGILKPIAFEGFNAVGTGTVVDSCIAQNVTAPVAIAAGILVNAQMNVLVQNCISSNNGYGILALDLMPPFLSSNGIITGNTLENNSIAGISDQTMANHAYSNNTARSNGPLGTDNFVGQTFPVLVACPQHHHCLSQNTTPVLLWQLPGAPCALDSNCVAINKLDNIDIRP